MTRNCTHPLTRRAVLAGLAAFATAPALAQGSAYSGVVIDTGPLGLGEPFSGFLRANLGRSLQRRMAGRLGVRGAPQLVVRLRSIQLASLPSGGGRRFGGGGASDYLQGDNLVVQGRQVIQQVPLTVNRNADGAWYLPDNEQQRTAALCDTYAGWLVQYL